MAQQDKRGEIPADELADEATLLKKRARRRLIGAAALAVLAAIVLPMVMDHKPAPPLRDIQVRIPSPDEGVKHRAAVAPVTPPPAQPAAARKEEKPATPLEAEKKADAKPEAKAEPKPEQKPEPKPVTEKPVPEKHVAQETVRAQDALEGKAVAAGAWEVQLGAYQNPISVTNLVGKLKQLGIPTYTEKIETPNGPRTRVRAGPFPSQEAAEKARARIKIVGVDGPVAKKP